jgi:hypothetical protein
LVVYYGLVFVGFRCHILTEATLITLVCEERGKMSSHKEELQELI